MSIFKLIINESSLEDENLRLLLKFLKSVLKYFDCQVSSFCFVPTLNIFLTILFILFLILIHIRHLDPSHL